jgi:hypothetical protein
MTKEETKKIKDQITGAKIAGFDAMGKIGELQTEEAAEQKKLTIARNIVTQLESKLKEK